MTRLLPKILICVARTRLAPAARDDLSGIRIYSKAAFGIAVAGAYIEGLRDVFRLLRDQQQAGRAEPDLGDGLRSFRYRSHRLYYMADEQGVLIVRILHHSRDVNDAFGSAP